MKETFNFNGDAKILQYQSITPYFESKGVHDLLEANTMQTTYRMALNMFLMGYIEGKRAERARRKGGVAA